ncbi:MAG: hypothetical protein ACE5J2_08975 [Nitrososphaerales archaeon]
MKIKTISAIALATILVISAFSATAYANPKGVPKDAKFIGKVNVIIHPNDWVGDDEVCPNHGHRIFFKDPGAGVIGKVNWKWDPAVSSLKVTDCDGTTDKLGEVHVPDKGKSAVYVRLLGPVPSEVKLKCEEINDVNDNEDLCKITDINITKGNSFVRIAQNLFADGLEGVTFTLEKVDGKPIKILELRGYLEA